MVVLSLFDGISCGQLALQKAGLEVEKYYASEIDENALKITQKNFPNTIHLGDVTKIKSKSIPHIDLLIGGSPCQTFSNGSFANGMIPDGFNGESGLFWFYSKFYNLLKKRNPKLKFLFENVPMKQEWQDIITEAFGGIAPLVIDSASVSAQRRKRLYWTNIGSIDHPKDRGILLKDIIQPEDTIDDKFRLSDKALAHMEKFVQGRPRWDFYRNDLNDKSQTVVAVFSKGLPYGCIRELKRKITPLECERLQTLPDNYTADCGVIDRYRYECIGNGWNIDTIVHILSYFNKQNPLSMW